MIAETGDLLVLTGKTIVSAVRPPYIYGAEFAQQCLFLMRLCWFPLLVSTIVFGYGAPGLQGGNFLVLFGSIDRLGGIFVIASIREFAPFVTAVILAGVGGTAITRRPRRAQDTRRARRAAGARRRPRQEPRRPALPRADDDDRALQRLRADLRHRRRRAGDAQRSTRRSARSSRRCSTNATVTDLWGSLLKTTLFGAIIAIVSCYKGMTASGGPEGVGRAVNQAVVIEFLAIFAFNVGLHAAAARHAPRHLGAQVRAGWFDVPRDLLSSAGEIVRFCAKVVGDIFRLPRLEVLRRGAAPGGHPDLRLDDRDLRPDVHHRDRPAGSSRRTSTARPGSPSYAGVFAAWCDLREAGAVRVRLHDGRQGRHRASSRRSGRCA